MMEPITAARRDEFDIRNDIKGLVILKIIDDSEAAKKGLIEGDVIMEINQRPVRTPKEAKAAVKEAKKSKRDSVLLLLSRAGDVRFIALKLND